MRQLNGSELAGFIKERQARQVRSLVQSEKITPKLAIIVTIDNPVIDVYVRVKKRYGADLNIDVEEHRINQSQIKELINTLNNDDSVHGVIVQLPLDDPLQTDKIVEMVAPDKDVDALGLRAKFEPATPMAILWLLAGYNIELTAKKILLIGRGKLVGAPLEKILKKAGHEVTIIDRGVENLEEYTKEADIVITATGSPAILYSDMLKHGAVVVDAGVASEDGKTVGDLAPEVYEREDLILTPQKGGVGPLTVCALFENVISAAQNSKQDKKS